MEQLAKYLRTKDQAKSGYNHTFKELLDDWAHAKIKSQFIDESNIRGRHNLFCAVRKLTFIVNDYPAKYENRKQELIIWEPPTTSNPFPKYQNVPYVNKQTLTMLIGTYIGSCFITQVVDWKDDGNIHIYFSLPH